MFNIIFKIEKWKWNKEYRIYVSNFGHFKDEHKQLLSIKISQKGYCYVYTNRGFKLAHRIVMLTWNPIPDAENLTIDHLNHNKRDNSLNNLEWVSRQENLNRANRDYFIPEYEKELSSLETKIKNLEKEKELYLQSQGVLDNNTNHLIQVYNLSGKIVAAFPEIKDARDWYIKKVNLKKDAKICSTVLNNIKKAIRTNKPYAKYTWKGDI